MASNSLTPMSVEQAAQWCGYSKPHIYKLIHEGKIPYYKPDGAQQGRVFLCKEELAQFIFGHRYATKDEIAGKAERLINREA